jgi:serine phosphatase RsbU (regulator of sigma subunit)/pSer/pThr/pTyr-binding forkhead associated (FHA) protein
MAVLREVNGDREYFLREKVTVIGREPACDIVVGTRTTSGRHALLLNSGGVYYVEDLNSVNGTYVNDQRIRQRRRLNPGDRLEIPGLVVTFQADELADQAAASQTLAQTVAETRTITSMRVPVLSSLEVAPDLRLAVKPEIKLRAILEISRDLGTTLDLRVVLPRILESLFAIFPQADCGFVLLRDPKTGQLVPQATKFRHEPQDRAVPLSSKIVNHALLTGRAILSADVASDDRFEPTQSIQQFQIHSIMCIPLLDQTGACLGVIQIDTRDRRHQFQQEDLDLLVCVGTQAARAVELARLHEERRELEAATRIQHSFLPTERPSYEKLHFFDYYSPAQHVGGDYYDYIPLPGNRLAITLGDVSGKDVSAALLMARLSAATRFCLASEPSVPEAVRQLNAVLTRAGSDDRFVTLVVAVVELDSFQLTLVNAGHMPPVRRRAGGGVEELGEAIVGLPLAVMDKPYEQIVVPFEPGDTLVLYTDGVSEARNPAGDLYGIDRVRGTVQRAAEEVQALGEALLHDVKRFAGERPQSDDLTIVCFGRHR